MGILGYTILTLCVLGVLCALILYFVAQKFKVYEDPRIDDVEKMLPGANCGGCGYAGCRTFASTAVGVDDMSGLFCPVGGAETMKRIADFLGKAAPVRRRVPWRRRSMPVKRDVRSAASARATAWPSAISMRCIWTRKRDCRSWTRRNVRPAEHA